MTLAKAEMVDAYDLLELRDEAWERFVEAEGAVLQPLPMRTVRRPDTPYVRIVKPLLDRLGAALFLVVASIPMAIVALGVRTKLGRPVFFRQERVGLDGETFEVIKFRSMLPDRRRGDTSVIHDRRRTHKSENDPRHTPFGRFLRRYSLDELPQFFNVLRGDMSFVGPRPELASVVETEYPPGLDQRHQVRPGLTGLWQISARNDGPMHENGLYDLEYVESVSWRTDLRILVRTPHAMLVDNTGN